MGKRMANLFMLDRLPERSDEEYTPRGRKDGFTYEREDTRYDYDYNRRKEK